MISSIVLPGTATEPSLPRARWACRAQFAALGLLAGAWGVHIPSVKQRYGLSELELAVVLLAAAGGALLALFPAGQVIARLGVARVCRLAAAVMGATLASVLWWPSFAWLLPALLVFGAAMSLFDVAINTEGSALEVLSGRTVMSNLHGMFSLGAMAGAALTATLLRTAVAPALQLAAIAAAAVALAAWAARAMLVSHPQAPDEESQAHFVWPRGRLLLIGLMIFAGMSAEGVMYDWSTLYLKQEVGLAQDLAALGYAAFSGAMALARFGGDALRARFAEGSLLRSCAALAATAMAVVLLSGYPMVALLGCALIGAGLAPVVPILYNAATRVRGASRAAAIAAVSSIGYAGFLIGPPLIGGIAQAASLTAAMSVVAVAGGLLALGARRVQ